jgi:hypothetical protein
MNKFLKSPISTINCILVGLIVLAGYFFDLGKITFLRDLLLNWAIILAGVALLVGLINLISTHLGKIKNKEKNSLNSAVLIGSFILTLIIVGYFGLATEWSLWIYNSILVPIETSLIAILATFFILTLPRMFSRRMGTESILFIIIVIFMLLGSISIFGTYIPGLFGENGLHKSIINFVGVSGIRGLLLGIALGATATGIRVIIGSDRPYGD